MKQIISLFLFTTVIYAQSITEKDNVVNICENDNGIYAALYSGEILKLDSNGNITKTLKKVKMQGWDELLDIACDDTLLIKATGDNGVDLIFFNPEDKSIDDIPFFENVDTFFINEAGDFYLIYTDGHVEIKTEEELGL